MRIIIYLIVTCFLSFGCAVNRDEVTDQLGQVFPNATVGECVDPSECDGTYYIGKEDYSKDQDSLNLLITRPDPSNERWKLYALLVSGKDGNFKSSSRYFGSFPYSMCSTSDYAAGLEDEILEQKVEISTLYDEIAKLEAIILVYENLGGYRNH